jgi:hypothetical protein
MRPRLHIPCCLLVLLMIPACDSTGPDRDEVHVTAVWAGEPWRGGAEMLTFADSLVLISWVPAGHAVAPQRTMHVSVPDDGPGVYAIGSGAAAVHYLLGGDVLTASYVTTAELSGTLTIDEITAERVRGSVEFEAASAGSDQPAGPQARFDGSFSAPRRSPYLR